MERYIEWLKEHGAIFDSIDWPRTTPSTGRGAVAICDVYPSQSFVTIPSKLIIDPPLCRRQKDIGPFLCSHKVFVDSDEMTLSFYLCHERLKAKSSFWEPYIEHLPKDTGSLYTWSKAELMELQDAGMEEYALVSGIRDRRELFNAMCECLDKASGAFKQITNLKTFSFELFSWAVDTVCCRSFGRRLRYVSLVPLADNLNHSNVQTKYSYDGNLFRLFPSGSNIVRKGAEAFNSYGRRSNTNLLLSYGFALENNEWDELSVALGLSKTTKSRTLKEKLFDGPYIAKLQRGVAPASLIAFFRVEEATDDETLSIFEHSSVINCSTVRFINFSNETRALSASLDELKQIQANFSTTEQEDLELLNRNAVDSPKSLKLTFALRYRIGRKQVIRLNMEFIERLIQAVEQLSKNKNLTSAEASKMYKIAIDQVINVLEPKQTVDGLSDIVALLKIDEQKG